jgi:BirA family biotin operon repressor/biotin-[acetyl-CoA-carboxylase] ligase
MSIPSDLAPEKIQAALRSLVIGHPLEVLEEVGSTNDVVMAAGQAGRPEGLAVIADRQTAGRGRRGRAWTSPPGIGLYTSVLLRPCQAPTWAALLTLVSGLAVVEAIREAAGLDARLKWPNDVLLSRRKVAGILTEMAWMGDRLSHVVVGIGINVNHGSRDLPGEYLPVATSLALAAGRHMARYDVAASLYNGLDRWYRVFSEGDTGRILAAGRERNATLGKAVDVVEGEARWRGLAVDLDGDGALLVREEGGEVRRVVAGEVSIREALAG